VCTAVRVVNGKYAGYQGIVTKVHEHQMARPKVRLLSGPSGNPIDPIEIDLRAEGDVNIESATNQPAAPHSSARAA
jgi:hypothetical protein